MFAIQARLWKQSADSRGENDDSYTHDTTSCAEKTTSVRIHKMKMMTVTYMRPHRVLKTLLPLAFTT